MRKFYAYVDESGQDQDTDGRIFIVGVVVVSQENQEELRRRRTCEVLERLSRKGFVKWRRTGQPEKIGYFENLLRHSDFHGKLFFTVFRETKRYFEHTIETAARAIQASAAEDYRVIVLFDGFDGKKERRALGAGLRKREIPIEKARGFRKEENDPLLRLADALCGLVRDHFENRNYAGSLVVRLLNEGFLRHLEE